MKGDWGGWGGLGGFCVRPAMTSQHRLGQQQLGQMGSEVSLNRPDKKRDSSIAPRCPSGHGHGGKVTERASKLSSAFGGAIAPPALARTTSGNVLARWREGASTQIGHQN